MELYHGSLNHSQFEKNVFFSTCAHFAKDYGEVKTYTVTMNHVFDTLNDQHVKDLLHEKGSLFEPYDEISLHSYDEYTQTDFFGCDNWEMFEQYTNEIKQMGYDSMRIFEGGIANFVVFHQNFKVL